jgi:hypothetical protein
MNSEQAGLRAVHEALKTSMACVTGMKLYRQESPEMDFDFPGTHQKVLPLHSTSLFFQPNHRWGSRSCGELGAAGLHHPHLRRLVAAASFLPIRLVKPTHPRCRADRY